MGGIKMNKSDKVTEIFVRNYLKSFSRLVLSLSYRK